MPRLSGSVVPADVGDVQSAEQVVLTLVGRDLLRRLLTLAAEVGGELGLVHHASVILTPPRGPDWTSLHG